MFYLNQTKEKRDAYKNMLTIIGSLSRLFSENSEPYLYYRVQENCFCRYFDAENMSRDDSSADARCGDIGIGLKTWVGGDDQKIAEFGELRPEYEKLRGMSLIKAIATYRNERIDLAFRIYGFNKLIYHIIKRIPGAMQIFECLFEKIEINALKLIENRGGKNNIYFTDGKHTYHFSLSKNTLYMAFKEMEKLDEFHVRILKDPYSALEKILKNKAVEYPKIENLLSYENRIRNRVCLRLYSENKKQGKFVPEKSGLNQWNALGRKRDPNEVYIPFPKEDRDRYKDFFPSRDIPFSLKLPNGKLMQAKICQADGKAIMSNPNLDLGKWILRDVLNVSENTLLTYDTLCLLGIDCVVFTKIKEGEYSIDFAPVGTYERYKEESIQDGKI